MKPKQLRLVRVDPMDPAQVRPEPIDPHRVYAMARFIACQKTKENMKARGIKPRYVRQGEIEREARAWIKAHPSILEEAKAMLDRIGNNPVLIVLD